MDNNFTSLVGLIESTHTDIAYDYNDYVKVAFAIAGEFGDAGRDDFLRICQQSTKFNEKDANFRYTNALRTGRGKVHISTVWWLAQAAGLDVKGLGFDSKDTVQYVEKPKEQETKSQETKNEDPKKAKKTKRNVATIGDIKGFLATFNIRYNVVSHKIEYKPSDDSEWRWLDDRTANSLWCKLCDKGFRCNINDFNNVLNSDFAKPYNPFKEYFDSLPEWNADKCPDYIEELADRIRLVNETPEKRAYLRRVFKKWLLAMVAGVLLDNFVNQYIFTLLGRQGIYKSSFFNLLLPPALREYFHAQLFKGKTDRDDQFAMAHNMLICIEEFDNVSQNEMNRLKAQTSICHINERKVYGRYVENMKRHNSFAATGNNTRILNDLTGNRRWLVFNVESIESPFKHPFNYEGIYSEAKALMDESEDNYIFTKEDNAEITEMNRDFECVCMEEELIRKYFTKPADDESGKAMSATDIIAKINIWVKDKLSSSKVGTVMKNMGFGSKKIHGTTKYFVNERTETEVLLMEKDEAKLFADTPLEPEQQSLPF